MKKLILILLLLTNLACSTIPISVKDEEKENKLVEITKQEYHYLVKLREQYCLDTTTAVNPMRSMAKKALILAIQTKVPFYPEEGICIDLRKTFKVTE